MSLRDYLEVAVKLAKDSGCMMLSASGKNSIIDQKLNFADLVTETDKAIEEYVFNQLRNYYPDHKFIGEESTSGKIQITDAPTWIIDPIDGTMNFVHQLPFCCISIGLTINKELVLGVVYSPFLKKLYTAIKGEGAYLNGQRIRTKDVKALNKALIICEFGSNEKKHDIVFENFNSFAWKVHGIRQFGSAALNICIVAEGACDAYFEMGIHCWDIAAGAIILKEAGGCLTDTNGDKFDLFSRRILVTGTQELSKLVSSNLKLHLEIENELS